MSNKLKSNPAGRFGVRYGVYIRKKVNNIEEKQRKKQECPFCNGTAKRISSGIWLCKKCKKRFAAHSYYLEKESLDEKLLKEAKFKDKSNLEKEPVEKKPKKSKPKKPATKKPTKPKTLKPKKTSKTK